MLSSRSEKETGSSEMFEKHTPKYPLPVEILKMKKDETVCQFCGVSYLIHNEIKKLEDRVKVSNQGQINIILRCFLGVLKLSIVANRNWNAS